MKRLIFMLGLILLITGNSEAIQTSNWLRESVVCIDSATGVEVVPESSHVVVSFGNCLNSHIYAARSTSPGADPTWIDSSSYAGSVPPNYFFFDQAGDIDADSGAGIYTVNVILWRGHTRTTNEFKFELTDSSFNNALTRVGQINEDTKNLTFTGTDVKATLDGETVTLADDGITAAKIANNAIGASEIADDAIDYATFAATPPTAWWPEGKTGYTASLNSAEAGSLNTLMADVDGIKAKTDSSSYVASGLIRSSPVSDVTLAGSSITTIWAYVTRTLTTADWSTHSAADAAHSVYDTLYVHKDDFMRWTAAEVGSLLNTVEDANKVNFMRWTAAEVGSLLNTIEDAHKANYKADVSNLDEPISGLDDNPWNNALTDTASGMGDWFADYFNAIFGPKFDSLVQSITDVNKANFMADVSGLSTHSAGDVWAEDTGGVALTKYGGAILDHDDYHSSGDTSIKQNDPNLFMADVSGVSTFDNTSDAVIVGSANSSSFDSVDFKPDYWSAVASHSDSGAVGSSPWTVAGVGSVYVYLDSNLTLSENLAHFWAACDSCYTRHFPEDGTANKDSFYVIDGKRPGADSLLGKGEFRHSNEVDVSDSTYFYKYPWWE